MYDVLHDDSNKFFDTLIRQREECIEELENIFGDEAKEIVNGNQQLKHIVDYEEIENTTLKTRKYADVKKEVKSCLINHDITANMDLGLFRQLNDSNLDFESKAKELLNNTTNEDSIFVMTVILKIVFCRYIHNNWEKIIQDHEERLSKLGKNQSTESRVEKYYKDEINSYNKIQKDGFSLHDIYVHARDKNNKLLINVIDEWYSNNDKDYGIMIIYGEPGHGKTSLCRNAVYEYKKGNVYFKNKRPDNVLWFPLNSANWNYKKRDIAYALNNSQKMNIEDMIIQLDECSNSIIFLDAYDEFYTKMIEDKNWNNFMEFYDYLYTVAKKNSIYFVITSKTNAIKDELDDIEKKANYGDLICCKMNYLNDDDQFELACKLKKRGHFKLITKYYKDYFVDKKTGITLLGIPVIFKMVMCNEYTPKKENGSLNQIRLYEELFDVTLERNISKGAEDSKTIRKSLTKLAARIFANNDNIAIFDSNLGDNELIYTYYIDYRNTEVGFIHRSFYQHYFAFYIYDSIKNCKNNIDKCKEYIKSLPARLLDNEEIELIKGVFKYYYEENDITREEMIENYYLIFFVLGQTGGILDEINNSGYLLENEIINIVNIFTQCLHINVDMKKTLGKEPQQIIKLLGKCNNSQLKLNNLQFKNIDFSRMNLRHADFSNTQCLACCFNDSDLSNAKFNDANLTGSRMRNCNIDDTEFYDATIDFVDFSETAIDKSNGLKRLNSKFNYGLTLGQYQGRKLKWRVLDYNLDDKTMLIITENIIDYMPYHTKRISITWNECDFQRKINEKAFIEDIFKGTDVKFITKDIVTNNNPDYGTVGGDISKNNQMFLLSIEEVNKYFKDDKGRACYDLDGCRGWWWLRSPGNVSISAAFVFDDGSVSSLGHGVDYTHIGVRPTCWIQISNPKSSNPSDR